MKSINITSEHVILVAALGALLVPGVLAVLPLTALIAARGIRELFAANAEMKKLNDNTVALAKALQMVSERTTILEGEIKKLETKIILSRGRQE